MIFVGVLQIVDVIADKMARATSLLVGIRRDNSGEWWLVGCLFVQHLSGRKQRHNSGIDFGDV